MWSEFLASSCLTLTHNWSINQVRCLVYKIRNAILIGISSFGFSTFVLPIVVSSFSCEYKLDFEERKRNVNF